MAEISIIVPCYNAEKFIAACYESISAQSFQDFEVIFINDGSTDRTGEILDSVRSEKFKVIHKANGGVSSARNAGLVAAEGRWVTFVDVDDKLKSDALKIMHNAAYDDCQMVFAGFEVYKDGVMMPINPPLRECTMSSLELACELFAPSDYFYQGFICSKMYRRELIDRFKIRFNQHLRYNEDRLFTFTYLRYAMQGAYTTKPVYEYYQHGDNAMAAINGENFWKFESDLDAFVEMARLAPAFISERLTWLLRKHTIHSYHWNRGLNKRYGNSNKSTNKRLWEKMLQVVPAWLYYIYWPINAFGVIRTKFLKQL